MDKIIERDASVRMYSIYDEKSGLFEPPFLCRTDSAASRMFARVMLEHPTIGQFPTDFKLYYVGLFQEETAELHGVGVTQLIMTGLQCKEFIESETRRQSSEQVQEPPTQVSDVAPVQPSSTG